MSKRVKLSAIYKSPTSEMQIRSEDEPILPCLTALGSTNRTNEFRYTLFTPYCILRTLLLLIPINHEVLDSIRADTFGENKR